MIKDRRRERAVQNSDSFNPLGEESNSFKKEDTMKSIRNLFLTILLFSSALSQARSIEFPDAAPCFDPKSQKAIYEVYLAPETPLNDLGQLTAENLLGPNVARISAKIGSRFREDSSSYMSVLIEVKVLGESLFRVHSNSQAAYQHILKTLQAEDIQCFGPSHGSAVVSNN